MTYALSVQKKGGELSVRRKVAVALVAILVALSFAGVAFAAAKTITGDVIAANASANTLMIRAQGQEMTFSVAEPAAKDLATLKPGDTVTVNYTEAGGKLTAQSVTKS